MNMKANYHTHTVFCDGIDEPEDVILSAIDKGFDIIGFSGHSHTSFDESYAMSNDTVINYRRQIRDLADKYRNRINVLCGIEYDYYSDEVTEGWDYLIGSVHYIRVPLCEGDTLSDGSHGYIPVDESAEELIRACERHYEGDIYSLVEAYFDTVSDVVRKTGCSIIGHFDLITKFNENGELFDVSHPRYINAWQKALKCLCEYNVPFEINSNAVCKGYRTNPYPSLDILKEIKRLGGRIVYSSDCHNARYLDYGFDMMKELAEAAGFDRRAVLLKDSVIDVEL